MRAVGNIGVLAGGEAVADSLRLTLATAVYAETATGASEEEEVEAEEEADSEEAMVAAEAEMDASGGGSALLCMSASQRWMEAAWCAGRCGCFSLIF